MMPLKRGWAAPVLEGRCPACLRSFPATTHLIQMNGSPSASHPGLRKTANDPFILNQVCLTCTQDLQYSGPRGLDLTGIKRKAKVPRMSQIMSKPWGPTCCWELLAWGVVWHVACLQRNNYSMCAGHESLGVWNTFFVSFPAARRDYYWLPACATAPHTIQPMQVKGFMTLSFLWYHPLICASWYHDIVMFQKCMISVAGSQMAGLDW